MTATGREHDCPLCGLHFAEGADCGPCPLKGRVSCAAVSCPRCGYRCFTPSGPAHLLRAWGCELKGWLRRTAPGF